MTLRTDDELDQALTELAQAEGVSKQEVVRRAVLDRRGRLTHRERIDSIATQAMADYKDALDRLGTV